MSKITKLRVKQPDGSFSSDIDLGAAASNVILADGKSVETKVQEINNAGYITKDVNNLTNYTPTTDLVNDYTKKTDFNGYTNTTNNRLDSIEAKISSVYKPMGSVNTYTDLAAKEATAEIGNVWNIIDTGKNYAWTGTEWDDLGGIVDLSGYYTKDQTYSKTEVDDQISGVVGQDLKDYVKITTAEATYVKLTEDQTINGTKTFSAIPVLPAAAPTEANQAASKNYVDTAIASAEPTLVWATKSDIDALF